MRETQLQTIRIQASQSDFAHCLHSCIAGTIGWRGSGSPPGALSTDGSCLRPIYCQWFWLIYTLIMMILWQCES